MIFAILGVLILFGFVVYSMNHYKAIKIIKFIYNPIERKNLTVFEKELVRLFNKRRKELGLIEVTPEVLASEVCKKIILKNISDGLSHHHNGFEQRLTDCKAVHGGEICNSNIITPYGYFMEYLKSKEHRECIENSIYTHIGICEFEKRNYCIFTKY